MPASCRVAHCIDAPRGARAVFSLDAPYPYATIVGTLVQATLIVYSIYSGFRGSLKSDEGSRAYLSVSTFVFAFLLQSLFNLHKKLDNPFSSRRIDVAHELAFNQLQHVANAFLAGGAHEPQMREGSVLAARLRLPSGRR